MFKPHVAGNPPFQALISLPAHALLSQEVADLHRTARDGHVDGEMSVTEAHLVQVTLGHTGHHVVDVRADGADARELEWVRERVMSREAEKGKVVGQRTRKGREMQKRRSA